MHIAGIHHNITVTHTHVIYTGFFDTKRSFGGLGCGDRGQLRPRRVRAQRPYGVSSHAEHILSQNTFYHMQNTFYHRTHSITEHILSQNTFYRQQNTFYHIVSYSMHLCPWRHVPGVLWRFQRVFCGKFRVFWRLERGDPAHPTYILLSTGAYHVFMYLYMYVCICLCVYVSIHLFVYSCMYVCMYSFMYVFIYCTCR